MSTSNLPKNVLSSPSQAERDSVSIRVAVRFHEVITKNADETMTELHQNRMKNLRKELDYLKETEWKHQPIEKYIGQSQ